MATNYFRVKKGLNLENTASSVSSKGDVAYNSATDKFEGYNGAVDPFVAEAKAATLTNKSIDAATNTLSNITNTEISASAAIAYSKLNLTGSIVNADINAAAAIVYSKLSLTGSIVNADINASAAIAYSKLNLTGSIVNADINAAAAIAYSKLNLTGSIVNADIGASAAIAFSKLASLTSGNILVGNGSNVATSVAVTGDISLSNTGVTAYSGTVPINKGGTGQTTASAGFNALSPMTTLGDIIIGGSSGSGTRLGIGSTTQVLTVVAGSPAWADSTGGSGPTANYFNGYMSNASSWANSNTSVFTDGTNSGGNSLTTVYSNGVTVTAGASNVAGITFTPPSVTAAYRIVARFGAYHNAVINGGGGTFRLTDGTTPFAWDMILSNGQNAVTERICVMSGIYVPGTTSAVTVKIQIISIAAGNVITTIGSTAFDASLPAIQWEVNQIRT